MVGLRTSKFQRARREMTPCRCRVPGIGVIMVIAMLGLAACSQESGWEASMTAGRRAADRGDYATAERNYSGAIVKAERFGIEDVRVAQSVSQLAQVYVAQGKFGEAEPLYLRALAIYQSARGTEHMDVAATLNNLGILHKMHGQYRDAEPYLTRALVIKEKVLGPGHAEVGLSLHNLALLYVAEERYDQAEPLLRRALAIREQGAESLDLARTLEQYAGVLRKEGRSAEADPLEMRAKGIRARVDRRS